MATTRRRCEMLYGDINIRTASGGILYGRGSFEFYVKKLAATVTFK